MDEKTEEDDTMVYVIDDDELLHFNFLYHMMNQICNILGKQKGILIK